MSTAKAIVARMWRDRGMLRELMLLTQRARPSGSESCYSENASSFPNDLWSPRRVGLAIKARRAETSGKGPAQARQGTRGQLPRGHRESATGCKPGGPKLNANLRNTLRQID